jgi:hypothetical protein
MGLLQPDLILEDVFAIDLPRLQANGIKGLLIDLDNTIVPWEESLMEERFITWVQQVKEQGFAICLVTNALENRTANFAGLLEIPAVGRAWKPLNRAFSRGLKLLKLPAAQVAVVGDQLFTDVLGGNRMGLFTILVNPLSTKELKTTKFMRRLEGRVLDKMVQKGQLSAQAVSIRKGGD